MLNANQIRALELDAEIAKAHATHVEAKSKIAQLESQRALLQTQSQVVGAARSGLSFVTVLVIALAAALAGAVLTSPPTRSHAAAGAGQ
jgi:hypothetical protein